MTKIKDKGSVSNGAGSKVDKAIDNAVDKVQDKVETILDKIEDGIDEKIEKAGEKLKGFVKVIVGKLGHGNHKSGTVLTMHSSTAEALIAHGKVTIKK